MSPFYFQLLGTPQTTGKPINCVNIIQTASVRRTLLAAQFTRQCNPNMVGLISVPTVGVLDLLVQAQDM
jgi:hypothetical protein